MGNIIHRGDIFYANLNDNVTGSEQTGIRPVIILQNNIGNYFSKTVIIAPITSRVDEKAKLPTHVYLDESRLPKKSIILTEQVRVIDKTRLTEKIDHVGYDLIKEIDKKLIIALGIKKENIKE